MVENHFYDKHTNEYIFVKEYSDRQRERIADEDMYTRV